ncbi:hypothetical protein [Reyranella sp.]|uniref:hypothetical protein n=1 Tax=Reyranella sp. TaxID=1929291 RepID=UPI003BA92AD7
MIKDEFKEYNEFIIDRLAQGNMKVNIAVDETVKRLYIEDKLGKYVREDINPSQSFDATSK